MAKRLQIKTKKIIETSNFVQMNSNNSGSKKYSIENIRPIFNNRLDYLKFIIKEYEHNYKNVKKYSKEDLNSFLKISIHNIENEIRNTLTEIQTIEMSEKTIFKQGKYCKKLNSIRTKFQSKLIEFNNENLDNECEEFLEFYDEIDEKLTPLTNIKLLSNHLENTKWFKNYISLKNIDDRFNGYCKIGSLFAQNFIKIKRNTNGYHLYYYDDKQISKEFKDFPTFYKFIAEITGYKNPRQFLEDTFDKKGNRNLLSIKRLNQIQEYCKENNIIITNTDFKP